jgi:uncharacterized membrane protein YheB (UPF0754 family)
VRHAALAGCLAGFFQALAARPDFWGFVSIPLVAATVTWAHVWFAMKMVFYPLEFVGVARPWLGWQGIVPRKSGKMADIVMRNTLDKVASLSEIFHEMAPDAIAAQITRHLDSRIEPFLDGVVRAAQPALWEKLPPAMRQPFYDQARALLPGLMQRLMAAMGERIGELIDLRGMIVHRLEREKALIVRTFLEVGDREVRFVVSSSFWIGMFFGTVQMIAWYFLPYRFGLPLYGCALGYLTNWVALNMVFRPLNPVRLGPFKLQGLFLRRQAAVSEKFAALATEEMVTVKAVMTEIMTGARAPRARALIEEHLTPLLESGMAGMMLKSLGPDALPALRRAIVERSIEASLEAVSDPAFNLERAAGLGAIFASRMKAMTPAEFQDVLRPAFHEDEWIIIFLGAVFGFLAGWVQLVVGFQ